VSKAEDIAKKGKLPKGNQVQLDEAHQIVKLQAETLEQSRRAVERAVKGEPLNQKDMAVLASVVGLNSSEIQELVQTPSDDEALQERVTKFFMEPQAYFYLYFEDDSVLKVIVRPEGKEEFLSDSDEAFE
jgi:hypothetical protein